MQKKNMTLGLDEAVETAEKENDSKVTTLEEAKKKRKPFHRWEVSGVEHKMKLNTGMIAKLENKYGTNVMNLVMTDEIPPLSVMLTVAQAAIAPWEHGCNTEKVSQIYESWLEEGGSQSRMLQDVILPTLLVSGFFTEKEAEKVEKQLSESDSLS